MGVVRKTNGVDRDHTPVAIEPGAAASTVDERSRTLLIVSDIRFLREGLAEVGSARDRLVRLIDLSCPYEREGDRLDTWMLWLELWNRAPRDAPRRAFSSGYSDEPLSTEG